MLDPSSSEEESDEGLEEESRDVLVAAGGSQRAPPAPTREGRRDAPGRAGGGGGAARSVSPSPSVLSEGRDEPERQLDDEQERRIRLQLYVFVVRCIAYPFNAKQPTDMARRQQKRNLWGQDGAFTRRVWGCSGHLFSSSPPGLAGAVSSPSVRQTDSAGRAAVAPGRRSSGRIRMRLPPTLISNST
ncbi:hypothetical protein H8959_007523, partial [Pygathrix nigripes]